MLRYALPLLALLILAAACSGDDNIQANDIVTGIPWSGSETATYQVSDNDNDDEVIGTLEMTIDVSDDGTTTLRQYFDFPGRGFINDATVTVDSDTLQPLSTHFEIQGPDGDLTCDAEYSTGAVNVHRVGEDGERDDSEDVPHTFYDSWSDLFVWRTISYDSHLPGSNYDENYADVLSCTVDRTQLIGVELQITDGEEIEVPAGTFETWHLKIDSGGETQDAWYSTDDAHRLIRYDNDELTFELLPPS